EQDDGGWHEQRTHPVLVRIDHLDGSPVRERLVGVIGVSQAERDLAGGNEALDLAVRARDARIVGLEVLQETLRLLLAPGREERRDMHGRGPEERVRDRGLTSPARAREVADGAGHLPSRDFVLVYEQDAGSGREAGPAPVGRAEGGR